VFLLVGKLSPGNFFCLLGLLYPEGEGNTLVRRGSLYQSTLRNIQEYFSALLQAAWLHMKTVFFTVNVVTTSSRANSVKVLNVTCCVNSNLRQDETEFESRGKREF